MDYVIAPHDNHSFQDLFEFFKMDLSSLDPVNRHEWQKLCITHSPAHYTHERLNVTLRYLAPITMDGAQREIEPDLPWAEMHFQERVSGAPMNPPPSFTRWPHHYSDSSRHAQEGHFDHTYPERIWPQFAGKIRPMPRRGIRFAYGDLDDVVAMLQSNIMTRQAFLPIWFPEDTGATQGQRVPCTIGYHFQYDPSIHSLGMTYMIRSCDLIRHFRNDVYMAVRLLQWVCARLTQPDGGEMPMGVLVMHMMNLHMMVGDSHR